MTALGRVGLASLLVLPSCFFLAVWAPASPPQRGWVHDAFGPVRGARVGLQGDSKRVFSGPRGRFCLPTSGRGERLVASLPGHRIASELAGAGPVRLYLRPLPALDNEDYAWVDPKPAAGRPSQCGNCHGDIFREWASSGHARSANNPRFLQLYAGSHESWNLLAEYPQGAGVCASCHAPTLRSPTAEYDMRHVEGVAERGVHCDFCHKVVDAPLDKLGTRFGKDGLVLLRPRQNDQLFFGPLDDAVRPGESFGYAPLYKDSAYCASCHEGVVFGVHVYGTYTEWQASPAARKGQHCQSCHMAPTGKMTNIAPGKGGNERDPWTLASHRFPGGTEEMLKRCVDVQVESRPGGAEHHVHVEVRAQDVGHRVPTGFIDRNLVLVVEAKNAAGKTLEPRRGSVLGPAAGKDYEGLAGWIYAKEVRDQDGKGPIPFWKPHDKIVDTRLVPGKPDRPRFDFVGQASVVRVRLLYRRFWPEVAKSRGWHDEIVIYDRIISHVDGKEKGGR